MSIRIASLPFSVGEGRTIHSAELYVGLIALTDIVGFRLCRVLMPIQMLEDAQIWIPLWGAITIQ
jgi:hypothetical protein